MEYECLDDIYTCFLSKETKTNTKLLRTVNSFVSVSKVKMCHNLIDFNNYKRQRWSMSFQMTFIPIFAQKMLKQTKYCSEAVNSFVSVSIVKMCHNPMHLTNHESQRWSMNVQTAFIPIFSQKRLKQPNICVEAVNSFVSISIIKICYNPKHLTNYMS